MNLAERLAALADPGGLLEAIFKSAPVGLQIYDRVGHTTLVNPAHTALFGAIPPPEYNIFNDNLLHEQGVVDLVKRAFAGERITVPPIWYDVRQLRNLPPTADMSGGRRVAIGAEMVPLRDNTGEVSHVLLVFHDVTEALDAREKAEAAAREAEQRASYSTFLAHAGRLLSASLDLEVTLAQVARLATSALADFCIVDLVNNDGSIRRVAAVHSDPDMQPLLDELRARFSPDPSSPQPAARVIASKRPELLVEVDPQVVADHARNAAHGELMLKLGLRSHVAVPLLIGNRTVGAISLGYTGDRRYSDADVPLVEALASHAAIAIDNARLFRAAQEARLEAETASRAKDEFLAMLGHELRNPLAPIVTALELTAARDGYSRERAIIERQVEHLHRLVDDLLDVSRITRGSLQLDKEVIDLAGPITEGIELARPLIEQHAHTVELHIGTNLAVLGDRVRLAQIVSNLMTNAARYTERGGLITVSADQIDNEVVLRVRDTGVGMPADLVPHVFDTFTRGGRAIDRAAGGLGLGLAIVKSLATMHGGRVAARSEGPGKGSEFEVAFPTTQGEISQRTPRMGRATTKAAARPDRCVLVVDDNQDAAELLSLALMNEGFQTVVASDPFEAITLAKQHNPRVALVDIGLPGMDGFELARRLRADPAHADLALVALTGYGQKSDRERTREAGFVEHLVKPVALDVVIPVVELLLARPAS